jgi:hypothetical protein
MSSKEAAHTWYVVIVVLAINEVVDLFALVRVAEEKTAQAVCLFAEEETRDASARGWPAEGREAYSWSHKTWICFFSKLTGWAPGKLGVRRCSMFATW